MLRHGTVGRSVGDGRQALVWRTLRGRRIAVHTPQGSYASRRAPVELREAERIATCLADLLEPAGQPPLELDIYLIDAVDAAPAHATAIVRLVAPERPGEPIAYPLTRQLVERWYGPRALTAAPLVDGLAGLVAARAQIGPPLDTVQASVNERLAGGHSVSPLATDADGSARTAFVAFLIERYGPEALRAALAGDQAAYQRPLGELEQAWLAAVRRKRREVAPWRSFLQHLLPLIGP